MCLSQTSAIPPKQQIVSSMTTANQCTGHCSAIPPNHCFASSMTNANHCTGHCSAKPLNYNTNQCIMHSSAQPLNTRTNINAYYQPVTTDAKKAFSCNCLECEKQQLTQLKTDPMLTEPIFPVDGARYGSYHHLPVITAQTGNWHGKVLLHSGATRSILSADIIAQIEAPLRENANYTASGINGQIIMRNQLRTKVFMLGRTYGPVNLSVMTYLPTFKNTS